MAMSMKDFLTLYFRQSHFDDMPEAKKSQFDSYVAKNDFRGDMKSWRDDLLKKDANGNLTKDANGHYAHNDLPDALKGDTKLGDHDWVDLYMALYDAFVEMNNGKKSFAEKKDKEKDGPAAVKFLNEYFGEDKVFAPAKLDDDVKQEINEFLKTFRDNAVNPDGTPRENGKDLYALLGLSPAEHRQLNNLIDKPNDFDKTENRDFISKLTQGIMNATYDGDIDDSQPIANVELRSIRNALYRDKEPTPNDIAALKSQYKYILRDLYKQPKVFKIFSEYDKGKISGPYSIAVENTDFDGKTKEANFIKPKYDDTLDWKEKLQKKTKDLYDDTLKKYITAHRDHIYVKDTAKAIGGVIVGLKEFNPNDGLDDILKNCKDKIIDKLRDKQPLKSIDHFKWFADKIESFAKNGKAKEVAGALRDGDKMNHLVETLAAEAIDEGKVEEAKTAMEVLKVMQQPFFSGRTMSAISKTDFKLFSDPGLSFNKSNSYIQSTMNALDATIGATIKGVALAGTGLASLYNRRNLGFNKSGELEKLHQQFEQENSAEKSLAQRERNNKNKANRAIIAQCKQDIEATGIHNKTELATSKNDLNLGRQEEQTLLANRDAAKKTFDGYDAINQDYDKRAELQAQQEVIAKELQALTEKLQDTNANTANQMDALNAERIKSEHTAKLKEIQKVHAKIKAIDDKYSTTSLDTEYANITRVDPTTGKSVLQDATDKANQTEQDYTDKKQENDKLANNIYTYESSKAKIATNRSIIRERNAKFAKWDAEHQDHYYELMGFWDFLQTGHTKTMFILGTKRAQKRLDSQKNQLLQDFMHDRGYAA